MKKIGLFLSSTPSSGGMFQYSLTMLSALLALPASEFSIVVAYIDPVWEEILANQLTRKLPIQRSRIVSMLAKAWTASGASLDVWRRWASRSDSAVEQVLSEGCDLWIFPTQDFWVSQFPVPTVPAIHDLMHRYERRFPEVSAWGRYRYRDAYVRDVCRRAKAILVDSDLGKQQLHESYDADPEKLFVLPYVPPSYIFVDDPGTGFERRYALPNKYLFYPAQFWRHKNHLGLVRAVARVKMAFPDVKVVLAGSRTRDYKTVVREITRLELQDNFFFAGYVPESDLPEFYRRSRGLVMPTFFGPTNIPPLEAFVLSCPVAISRIYGMPEQVGDAALLFDPMSIEEMAACMSLLWTDDDLCRRLIARGRERAAKWGQSDFNAVTREILGRLTNQHALSGAAAY